MSALNNPPAHLQNAHAAYVLYVGTYAEGIYAFRFHVASGKLEALGLKGELKNPSFVVTDPLEQHLYAVSEVTGNAEGAVAAFSIDRGSGDLKKLNTESSAGVAPCHLAVDRQSKAVFVANYSSGSVASFPLGRDGMLAPPSSVMRTQGSSVDPKRQTGPHAHQVVISPDNRVLYTPDLGLDQIRIFSIDSGTGKLREDTPLKVEPGTGPRHMVLTGDGRFAYVLSELKTLVSVYKRSSSTKLELIQTTNSLPDGKQADGGAEILLHPSGKFLYTSNRDVTKKSTGSISVFRVDSGSGKVTQIQNVQTAGRMPRGVEFDPSGKFLLVGDQNANEIQIFEIGSDGKLKPTEARYQVPSPVSFAFVPLE